MICSAATDQWVTISLIYWLSAVSRKVSWPQVKLCQDKWDYQPDPSHCYSTWASQPDRRGATGNGVTIKREMWGACTLQYSNTILRTEPGGVEILPPCSALHQLEDRPGKACSAEWDSVMVRAGQPPEGCWSSICSPARHGNRQSWTGSSFFSVPAEVARAVRMLSGTCA